MKKNKIGFMAGITAMIITLGCIVLFLTGCDNSENGTPTYYTVTFELNGGTSTGDYTDQEIESGEKVTEPTAPQKTGYESKFAGWYNEALTDEWDFATDTVTEDITLFAKWVPYELGDTGPADGIIFYIAEDTVNGFEVHMVNPDDNYFAYYLEAAPEDFPEKLMWASDNNTEISGTQTGLGTGRKNTAILHAFQEDTTPAATACFEYGTDWFLPSKDELQELYSAKEDGHIDNFEDDGYWSSSKSSMGFFGPLVEFQRFSNGNQEAGSNSAQNYVRAVRAF